MTRHSAAWLALLTAGTLALAPRQVAAELQVDYHASRLSVTAADVTLPEVLRAIGGKVGFTVSDAGGVTQPVTVSVRDASVDDVLRQLLRTQNHTILYRASASAEVVDRIVLLGLPGQGGSPVVASAPPVANPAPRPPAAVSGSVPAAAQPPAAGRPPESDQSTVGDMLRSHAVSGMPPQVTTQPAEEPPAAAAPGTPAALQESLATATRRAQEGLSSLVQGLERATQSLQGAPAAPQGR